MSTYSEQQLASRIKNIRAIENVMGKYAFYTYYKRFSQALTELWCSEAPCPTFTDNTRKVEGYTAIKAALLDEKEAETVAGNEIMRRLYPDKFSGSSDSEMWGAGTAVVHTMTTPVIELAEDEMTAKGMWYSLGAVTEIEKDGPVAYWQFEKYAVDFVFEDGWRIWHMTVTTDFKCPVGENWAEINTAPSGEFYNAYFPKQQPQDIPPVPQKYKTFAETFAY